MATCKHFSVHCLYPVGRPILERLETISHGATYRTTNTVESLGKHHEGQGFAFRGADKTSHKELGGMMAMVFGDQIFEDQLEIAKRQEESVGEKRYSHH